MKVLKQFIKFSGFALLILFSCYLWVMSILFRNWHWATWTNLFILILFGLAIGLSSKKEGNYLSLIMISVYFLGGLITFITYLL